MATVAEELLNDFGSLGDEADEENDGLVYAEKAHGGRDDAMELDGQHAAQQDDFPDEHAGNDLHDLEDAEATKARVEKMKLGDVKDVRSVASLMQTLEPVMEKIAHFRSQSSTQTAVVGNIEDHPEYSLLTQSNNLSTMIDGEVALVHKFTRDHYSTRFPELERLVTTPLEYAKVVTIIATDNPLGMGLKAVLDGPSLMIVTVEATTSKGDEMSDDELQRVRQACDMVISLHRAKLILTEYVQSRMTVFAPNLTALIGSLTAAQLLNAAGGLTGLSKTPACNIPSWGSKKRQAGLATNIGIRQQGYLYHSEMVQHIPNDMKKQAMRIVAAKLVLAARVDRIHSSPDGRTGDELRSACIERLEKLTEPPPNKGQRALPIPDDKPSRKRGGRRARKAKEALAMTDLRKEQNRMAFGKEEQEVGYGTGESTVGMGMIGQKNDGRIRALQVDNRTRAKLSAKNKGLRAAGVGSSARGAVGTTSSLTFTPVQGLELVDPKVRSQLGQKRKAEEDRWFKGGSFTQVGSGGGGSSADVGSGGFKVPEVPAAKRVDTGATKMEPPPSRKQ
ncbi:snoRNA binding domain, fibrillarin domain-containing protein [Hirsutella rhossiliensis]|uniref:SnoRNA binding domain, fibrillarin domain-containing protein n=1 Tax=Hirsutella rhossiliensis TaxID=111463 RepID=A0A9P8MJ53_9HYPO|nr:snoRNA binding domain, fibrillarin domain-containing protein [Hirsutella rhossiliensis]KAH0957313.1 snoRNA binding domain, fibrillarin domain-containing protein [Hirsutella rhossiliensis]